MKFCFCNSVLMVMSCHNRVVDGSVFTKFHNSTLGVMSWRSSTSTTLLRRECHHEVPQFCCYRECLHKVPLLQIHSWGNVMSKFSFRSSQSGVFIFMKFCNSVLGVMSCRSSASATPDQKEMSSRRSAILLLRGISS